MFSKKRQQFKANKISQTVEIPEKEERACPHPQ